MTPKPMNAEVDPLVADELEQIRRRHRGIIRPEDVVAFASDPTTALHARFCWDDTKAAELYRIEQARRVIRCVVTVVDEGRPPVRAYVSLRQDRADGDSYREIRDVLSVPDLRKMLLAQALREAEAWRQRYERLADLAPIVRAIERVRRSTAARPPKPMAKRLTASGRKVRRSA